MSDAKKRRIIEAIKEKTWISAEDIANDFRWNRPEARALLSEMVKEETIYCETDEDTGINYFGFPPNDEVAQVNKTVEIVNKEPKKMSKSTEIRSTNDIRRFLMEQMEAVAAGKQSPEEAKAICAYTQQLYNITKLEIDYAKIADKLVGSMPKVKAIELADD